MREQESEGGFQAKTELAQEDVPHSTTRGAGHERGRVNKAGAPGVDWGTKEGGGSRKNMQNRPARKGKRGILFQHEINILKSEGPRGRVATKAASWTCRGVQSKHRGNQRNRPCL